jgi:DNA-binding transcriptional regulator YhcF (GntR family)
VSAVAAPGLGGLRRALGAQAWVALEVIVARSHAVDGEFVAHVSVRALATELGVAKDTAARAVGLLRDRGVVTVCQARGRGGRFGVGPYVIAAEVRALMTAEATKSLATGTRAHVSVASTSPAVAARDELRPPCRERRCSHHPLIRTDKCPAGGG